MDETQNVNTQRRCRQQCFDLPDSENEFDISYQSLPNSMSNRDEMTELKIKLDKLNMELQIANNEIETLNIENNTLKKELSTAQHKIGLYKSVGTLDLNKNIDKSIASPLKFYSPQYRKRYRSRCLSKGLTRTSSIEQEINAVGICQNYNETKNLSHFFGQPEEGDVHNITMSHQPSYRNIVEKGNEDVYTEAAGTGTVLRMDSDHGNEYSSLNNDRKSNTNKIEKTQIKRIHQVKIFADQTGLEIRSMLQELLGNSFHVTSVVKPGAPMAEVISSCADECKELTSSDYVLILGGSNDSNPLNFQSVLYYTLGQIEHTNVLVGKLYKNMYLNVKMLNNSLKLVCSHFVNTMFLTLDLDQTNFELNFKYINTRQASRLILKEILHLKYRNDYLNYVTTLSGEQKCYNDTCTQTENETRSKRYIIVTNSISTQTDSTEDTEFFRT